MRKKTPLPQRGGTSANANKNAKLAKNIRECGAHAYETLLKKNIAPTPKNFTTYFDMALNEREIPADEDFELHLYFDENIDNKKILEAEIELRKGFAILKNGLELSSSLYKNISVLKKTLVYSRYLLVTNKHPSNINTVISTLEKDIFEVDAFLMRYVEELKNMHQQNIESASNLKKNSIYDSKFLVYNKAHFLEILNDEIKVISKIKHESMLVVIIPIKNAKNINKKIEYLIAKHIAALINKVARRSDVVGHLDGGVFVMLLKHTSEEEASNAISQFRLLMGKSNVAHEAKTIPLQALFGAVLINSKKESEEMILEAINNSK